MQVIDRHRRVIDIPTRVNPHLRHTLLVRRHFVVVIEAGKVGCHIVRRGPHIVFPGVQGVQFVDKQPRRGTALQPIDPVVIPRLGFRPHPRGRLPQMRPRPRHWNALRLPRQDHRLRFLQRAQVQPILDGAVRVIRHRQIELELPVVIHHHHMPQSRRTHVVDALNIGPVGEQLVPNQDDRTVASNRQPRHVQIRRKPERAHARDRGKRIGGLRPNVAVNRRQCAIVAGGRRGGDHATAKVRPGQQRGGPRLHDQQPRLDEVAAE